MSGVVDGVDSDVFGCPHISTIRAVIGSNDASIVERMKMLYYARHKGGPEAVEALQLGLNTRSNLLRHEIAYVLGQLGEPSAIPILTQLLSDPAEDDMVRHEAAEALAAVKSTESLDLIREYASDASLPAVVRETCELAVRSLEDKKEEQEPSDADPSPPAAAADESDKDQRHQEEATQRGKGWTLHNPVGAPSAAGADSSVSPYNTVDPLATKKGYRKQDIPALRQTLLDHTSPLWLKYESLFALRNLGGSGAVEAVSRALTDDRTSALFRHELAFVLGQMQSEDSVSALVQCLGDASEHPMARHEAALALGAIGSKEAIHALERHVEDPELVVSESCLVGLAGED